MQVLNDGLSVISYLVTTDIVIVCGMFSLVIGLMLLILRLSGGK